MSLVSEQQVRRESVQETARRMVTAARTAPKSRGRDYVVAAIAEGETIREIADHMRRMVERGVGSSFYLRDADNLEAADALVLIGTKIVPTMLDHCGLCGFADCTEKAKHPEHPCAFNTGDLGIAIGSAVSIAADMRVDNRIMFSVGMAVREMELLGQEVRVIYGIPLSVSGKNTFFDRKPKT
ncbi:MAG: DUF2148 domain-containing protein [Sphaerochaetaceae bacterium]|nr:DUF2148 domain-containing protein [Sphaerochaetaceae bacterium]MDX9940462.1 DUF2148 domain-containing protein [Sphaerochaetaceae bacterium]